MLHESYLGYHGRMLFFGQLLFFYSIRLGFAHMNHSIEDDTAQATFDLLVGPATCLQLVADELLIATDLRFRQRTSMIATGLFPRLASLVSNGSKDLIPRQRGCLTITMLLDLSVFAQRNDGLNRRAARRRGQGVENLLFVIRTIPRLPPPPPRRLGSTGGRPARHHRFRLDVNVWATTSPVASWTPTCSLRQVRRLVQPCWRTFHSPSP